MDVLMAAFISIFTVGITLSSVTAPQNYQDFCNERIENPKTCLDGNQQQYQDAKSISIMIGIIGTLLTWWHFVISDLIFKNKQRVIRKDALGIKDGSES